MSEKPKRPWFRFQLLTLVLITLSGGVLVGVNCISAEERIPATDDNGILRGTTFEYTIWQVAPTSLYYGWPTICLETYKFNRGQNQWRRWLFGRVLIDVGAASGIMFVVALVSEFLLRRHE